MRRGKTGLLTRSSHRLSGYSTAVRMSDMGVEDLCRPRSLEVFADDAHVWASYETFFSPVNESLRWVLRSSVWWNIARPELNRRIDTRETLASLKNTLLEFFRPLQQVRNLWLVPKGSGYRVIYRVDSSDYQQLNPEYEAELRVMDAHPTVPLDFRAVLRDVRFDSPHDAMCLIERKN